MTLNDYKNEVRMFLVKTDSLNKNTKQKINWLEKEFDLLKAAVENSQDEVIQHQVYDMIYLLFEIAADSDCDLNKEWSKGSKRKQKKYIDKRKN